MKQWCCVAAQTKNAQNVQINLNSRCREENHQLQDQRAKSCMSPKWCLGVGRCCPGGSPTPTVWHPPPKTPTHSDTHTGTYCASPSHNLTLVTLVPPFLHLTTATHISYLTPRTISLPYGHCFAVSLLWQCNVWSKTHAWPWNVCLLLTTGPMPKHFKMTKKCVFCVCPPEQEVPGRDWLCRDSVCSDSETGGEERDRYQPFWGNSFWSSGFRKQRKQRKQTI